MNAQPAPQIDLDKLLDRIGDAQYVLLGEASHGTHEYYTWRSQISKRLILEKGFSFIAVEGDWPDCYRINRYVKGYADAGLNALEVLHTFNRWPTWMWANWEIVALTEWLRKYNQSLPYGNKIGFYGLDVYSLWESLDAMVNYLKKEDPQAARVVERAIQCFAPYGEEGQEYAMATKYFSESCRDELIQVLQEVRKKSLSYDHDLEASLNTEQNAIVALNAERYYQAMVSFGAESWNIRDTHMAETLDRLVKFHGEGAKAIVWEHNTHIGDARYTDMRHENMVNVGQLTREVYGEKNVVLVGFGSYEGLVIAGDAWDAPMEKMIVPPAKPGSVEALLHNDGLGNQLLIFDNPEIRQRFDKKLGHRAIGVVYHPERERFGNYVATLLPSRYDAFIFLDKTQALHPLKIHPSGHQTPETFPFGV
ncbi:erythromycin esterase family protein [Rhodocytophaga aerolata]|uniref:Erythromycin esterase family protein n=1 Tax=Rhodocytophaga aerolata TaxID=455078 RepID=A0ABT8R7G1_9BACT|nr:erythromycin esterase family protein [Rhodocytophaga aerolata]MDO1448027.1 erythromycin esterase family protein [Rhodocytophaga aerolata]